MNDGGVAKGHWYRVSTQFDTVSDRVLSVSFTDPAANSTVTATPDNSYMMGGRALRSRGIPSASLASLRPIGSEEKSLRFAPHEIEHV